PFPEPPGGDFPQPKPFKAVYDTERRSVYMMTQRIQRHPYLALFDGPDPNTTSDHRFSSTVPLQALFLMNNPGGRETAEGFAQGLIAAAPDAPRRIGLAYAAAYGRPSQPDEIERGDRFC